MLHAIRQNLRGPRSVVSLTFSLRLKKQRKQVSLAKTKNAREMANIQRNLITCYMGDISGAAGSLRMTASLGIRGSPIPALWSAKNRVVQSPRPLSCCYLLQSVLVIQAAQNRISYHSLITPNKNKLT
jgi:hypothetical protein